MQVKTAPIEIVGNSNTVRHNLTIDPKDVGTVIKALVTGIYTNPLRTILIEYVQNALDAHRAAEESKNVKITLPSHDNPNYIVEDWGVGLTDQEIYGLLSKICASNKRTDKYAGGFGIGFYAASAYCDTFTFRIRKNGIESLWVAGFGQGNGALVNLNRKPTKEPNGVKITIPIESSDVDKIHEMVKSGLYAWIDGIEVYTQSGERIDTSAAYTQILPGVYTCERLEATEVYIYVSGLPIRKYTLKEICEIANATASQDEIYGIQYYPIRNDLDYKMPWIIPIFLKANEAELTTNREGIRLTPVLALKILTQVKDAQMQYYKQVSEAVKNSESLRQAFLGLPNKSQVSGNFRYAIQKLFYTLYPEIFKEVDFSWEGVVYKGTLLPATAKKVIIRRKSTYKTYCNSADRENGVIVWGATAQKYELAQKFANIAEKLGIPVEYEYTPKAKRITRKRILARKLGYGYKIKCEPLYTLSSCRHVVNIVTTDSPITRETLETKIYNLYLYRSDTRYLLSNIEEPGTIPYEAYIKGIGKLEEISAELGLIYENCNYIFMGKGCNNPPIWEVLSKDTMQYIWGVFAPKANAAEIQTVYEQAYTKIMHLLEMPEVKATGLRLVDILHTRTSHNSTNAHNKYDNNYFCERSYKNMIIDTFIQSGSSDYDLLEYIVAYFTKPKKGQVGA